LAGERYGPDKMKQKGEKCAKNRRITRIKRSIKAPQHETHRRAQKEGNTKKLSA